MAGQILASYVNNIEKCVAPYWIQGIFVYNLVGEKMLNLYIFNCIGAHDDATSHIICIAYFTKQETLEPSNITSMITLPSLLELG